MKKISMALAALSMAFAASACTTTVSGPSTYQDCGYDYYGYYYCSTYYYNGDGTTDTSRDMITDIAQAEQQMLSNQAKHYATKFSLSEEQGMKIAKTINDFNTVQSRSDKDVAEFAQRLYGVNPSKIVSAVGAAQAGDNAQLNDVVAEAAKNFNTTSDNMKQIVKNLHGKMLEQQGIRF
jgi:hypothetical protein